MQITHGPNFSSPLLTEGATRNSLLRFVLSKTQRRERSVDKREDLFEDVEWLRQMRQRLAGERAGLWVEVAVMVILERARGALVKKNASRDERNVRLTGFSVSMGASGSGSHRSGGGVEVGVDDAVRLYSRWTYVKSVRSDERNQSWTRAW